MAQKKLHTQPISLSYLFFNGFQVWSSTVKYGHGPCSFFKRKQRIWHIRDFGFGLVHYSSSLKYLSIRNMCCCQSHGLVVIANFFTRQFSTIFTLLSISRNFRYFISIFYPSVNFFHNHIQNLSFRWGQIFL